MTMRAVVFDGPAPDATTTRVGEVPVPAPGPGRVAIEVAYAGVNFIDIMARRGDPGYATWPFIPGLEVAGVVTAVGEGVTGRAVGDRVVSFTGRSGLAEVAVAPAELVVDVPGDVPLEHAAAVPTTYTTAVLLLEATRPRPGEPLLMHSAGGGLGQAFAQVARARGLGPLLGTVGDPARLGAAQEAGFDTVVVRGADGYQQLRTAAPSGVRAVFDTYGGRHLDDDLAVLARMGRIVVIGNAEGGDLPTLPPLGRLFALSASIGAFSVSGLAAAVPAVVAGAMRSVLDDVARGALTVRPAVADGLAAVPGIHQELAEGRSAGQRLVRIAGEPAVA